jgi:hypothetical protein
MSDYRCEPQTTDVILGQGHCLPLQAPTLGVLTRNHWKYEVCSQNYRILISTPYFTAS